MNDMNNRFDGRPKISFILNRNHENNTNEELSDILDKKKTDIGFKQSQN